MNYVPSEFENGKIALNRLRPVPTLSKASTEFEHTEREQGDDQCLLIIDARTLERECLATTLKANGLSMGAGRDDDHVGTSGDALELVSGVADGQRVGEVEGQREVVTAGHPATVAASDGSGQHRAPACGRPVLGDPPVDVDRPASGGTRPAPPGRPTL